ncbi:sensor histidine kinase [Vibrio sp. LaRot3]|uniref:sensor histidine kinase n=1 Tax=Vibrio sp. LaRot3 TaxID=2998829 RepID=UPI0022CE2C12|nr:ATP-binding protein [Vibrio sp. LaRot3]MDA0148116.1 ATP-binding protein [Vibrio sp. LaRot3]
MERTNAEIFLSDGRFFVNQYLEQKGTVDSLYKQLETTGHQPFYIFDLKLVKAPTEVCLSCKKLFVSDGVSVYEYDDALFRAYFPLPNTDSYLRFTERREFFRPQVEWYQDSEILFVLTLVSVITVALALMVYCYIYRLHKQIFGLNRIQQEFGKGQLTNRATLSDYKLPVRDLANSFNSMAEEIERRVKQNQIFTQAIPHELRTPLSRIQLASDLARKHAHADHQVFYQDIDRYVEDIAGFTDSLVTLSRLNTITSGVEKIDANALDLVELLKQRIERIVHAECHFTCNLGSNFAYVMASNTLCHLVIDNLLQNAVRYGRGQISVTLTECEEHFVIDVEDNGLGIPKDKRQEIFMAFSRLDRSRNRDHNGFGLGLTIVRNVCQTLNWSIAVDDSALGGARFTVMMQKL